MNINVGDKIVSDDYAMIGVLTKSEGKLFVVDDFRGVPYESHCADWELYSIWEAKTKAKKEARGGIFKRLIKAIF